MDAIAVDCSWADAQLRQDSTLALQLPAELRAQIVDSRGSSYLDAIATAARLPLCTDRLLCLYRPLVIDSAARWTSLYNKSLADSISTLSALARILPFAPYLAPSVAETLQASDLHYLLSKPFHDLQESRDDHHLSVLLIAVFRLLSYRRDGYDRRFMPTFFTSLLRHESRVIRYLAIECLCLLMHYADAFLENLIEIYVGTEPIPGKWETIDIDYRVVKLWEERRWKNMEEAVTKADVQRSDYSGPDPKTISSADLHPRVALMGGIILPRQEEVSLPIGPFVEVASAHENLASLGQALLAGKPLLLTGPAGSGKTSLIMEAARILNKQESLITLHLNEQTDAKSLIGMHTSSTTGDSFVWQPGVLTRALQQGRWVLIEDIDRAPAEVLGVLRPLVENGSLFIPNRKLHIKAKQGFKIIGTVRTASDGRRNIGGRHSWLMSKRLWSVVTAQGYSEQEIGEILCRRYPRIARISETILEVHGQLLLLYRQDSAFKTTQTRLPALRDLLKWCRRIDQRVATLGLDLSKDPVPETFQIHVFKDAINCYASHLSDLSLYNKLAAAIARVMNIAPQQRDFYMDASDEIIAESNSAVTVGRSQIPRISVRRSQNRRKPFANTAASRRGLENVAASIDFSEPCLLVGETGVGKTSLVQHIASLVGQVLTVVNLSQQSEVSDLLGGLKPVTTRSIVLPMVEQFTILFDDTFSANRNEKFLAAVNKAISKESWARLLKLWQEALQMADKALNKALKPQTVLNGNAPVTKRRKIETPKYEDLRQRWLDFENAVKQIHGHVERGAKTHTFAFVEGRVVQAVRHGEWLLLDEINLASSDTLDHIVSLLADVDGQRPSILLAEAGSVEKVVAHPNFKVFAAMNPATDAGKKDLPPALRSRFTELYVQSGDDSVEDLVRIIQSYLGDILSIDKRAALDLARTYQELQQLNRQHRLTDGAGDAPHFSIRSLVRCLQYVMQHSTSHGLRRSMYEGFAMSFFTSLSRESENLTLPIVEKHLLSNVKNVKSFLSQQPKLAQVQGEFVAFRHHLISKGANSPDLQPHYIRTASVERNLMNLARAASMRRFPILLQGPTSAGKTSMVEYLAKLSGNRFVRINNHEHTDLQEYLGSYASDTDGRLKFKEGVLVDALRQGHWIVLDELNLAPSDVLEALNRLLDDNRELMIPETQEIVRPHPNFMLFATQNPAGLYGGRKRLSRAFRNRFLEIHFDDIPEDELEVILRERAQIAPSFCTQIVAVYKKLSLQRQSSRLFEQRNSFATLRDLFRWASRPVDDRQQLAQHGFMLLGERVREHSEREIVKSTIEETMKIKIDEHTLYSNGALHTAVRSHPGIVWTAAMRRLFVLVSEALKNKEPILLVGETGCGKTQICQVVAAAFGRPLNIYNAHTNTETGDLIGSQRPVRSRAHLADDVIESVFALISGEADGVGVEDLNIEEALHRFSALDSSQADPGLLARARTSVGAYQALFTWSDGNLVRSMKLGEHFLLDEISLADDSVLERLNSVLEPARTIVLAEKGSTDNVVVAETDFQFLATMNPGGDFGKRELSAALRNRMTEIWVPPLFKEADVLPIVEATLDERTKHLAPLMLKFTIWFKTTFHKTASTTVPLRDLLTWAKFINAVPELETDVSFIHGAGLVFVDSIGANPSGMTAPTVVDVGPARLQCLGHLQELISSTDVMTVYNERPLLKATGTAVNVGSFKLQRVAGAQVIEPDLVFDAPTTLKNTMRIVRALQLDRPVLLEGNPGVGKTAIVTALAQAVGKSFTRINLSDQTDLMDLFGADSPSENESLGRFSWKDGPLLQAMQDGGWVLLDEMNLASQSVLEGLNSCLDHRKEAYIAELDKTFTCHPEFKLFAAQNPHHQGGGRKGLPASFVNRFTVVYADPFEEEDLLAICRVKYPQVNANQLTTIVRTVAAADNLMQRGAAFHQGGPWEINLRDVSRWLDLCQQRPSLNPMYFFDTIIRRRFRTKAQDEPLEILSQAQADNTPPTSAYSRLERDALHVGTAQLQRFDQFQFVSTANSMLPRYLPHAQSVITAVEHKWPVVLVGSADCGKTELIRHLAAVSGNELVEISMNADIDTMDLLGGFEQYDAAALLEDIKKDLREVIAHHLQIGLTVHDAAESAVAESLNIWRLLHTEPIDSSTLSSELSQSQNLHIQNLASKLRSVVESKADSRSRFVWNDGILIDAVDNGYWVVLDNANLCNASVLDRLNSLLEPNGHLVISEQHIDNGNVRTIRPHPNFRIFLTMDPRNGELSRAMRNRSLEVYMSHPVDPEERSDPLTYPVSSSMSRLRKLAMANESIDVGPFIGNLSDRDAEVVTSAAQNQSVEDLFSHLKASSRQSLLPTAVSRRFESSVQSLCGDSTKGGPEFTLLQEPKLAEVLQASGLLSLQGPFRLWQLHTRVAELYVALEAATYRVQSVGLTELTVFERSAASIQSKRLKAPTLPAVFAFVKNVYVSLIKHFETTHEAEDQAALSITSYLIDLVSVTNVNSLDPANFQGYLQIGNRVAQKCITGGNALANKLQAELRLFSVVGLKYGRSLQAMWSTWKPKVPESLAQLQVKLALEELLRRFDTAVGSMPRARADTGAVKLRLLEAVDGAWKSPDAEQVVAVLTRSIEGLEQQTGRAESTPVYFVDVFEYLVLRQIDRPLGDPQTVTLLPFVRSQRTLTAAASTGSPLQKALSQLASLKGSLDERGDDLAASILQSLSGVEHQPLRTLEQMREELQCVARATSGRPLSLSRSQVEDIVTSIKSILSAILQSNKLLSPQEVLDQMSVFDGVDIGQSTLLDAPGARNTSANDEWFAKIYESDLLPAMKALSATKVEPRAVGRALIHTSIAALTLMVPDKPFDPALLPQMEAQRHKLRQDELYASLIAQKEFSWQVAGSDDSLVSRLIEHEMSELGEAPTVTLVARPEESSLASLQADFQLIIQAVIEGEMAKSLVRSSESQAESIDTEATRFFDAVDRIVDRLNHADRAYDDLVVPIIQLLQIMGLGVEMIANGLDTGQGNPDASNALQHAPLLGSKPCDTAPWPLQKLRKNENERLQWLRHFSLSSSLQEATPSKGFDGQLSDYFAVLDSFYAQWKERLSKDQAEAEAKSRYYAYRGDEDHDESADAREMNELFPVYDEDGEAVLKNTDQKTLVVQLGQIHNALFCGSDKTARGLYTYILNLMDDVSRQTSRGGRVCMLDVLPGILLQIEDKMHSLQETDRSKPFNIYTDPNIREVRSLQTLVHSVEVRFWDIAERWPEHAVPVDVLSTCKELMTFKLNEPLAKLLSKTEKLLDVVAQWQSVASREWSVSNLVDEITALIISWRRLELSSWSALLDLEKRKNDESALSWFFIAYEAMVYNSRAMVEGGGDITAYCFELAKTLEEFLRATTLGQYGPRLMLLRGLAESLRRLSEDNDGLVSIVSCVRNVIAHYRRYEETIAKTLQSGRVDLEQAVTEQIKLASWKDTNVTALKDSARRSHHKLFKVVKKYRALLGQPISSFKASEIKADVSDQSRALSEPQAGELNSALALCSKSISDWQSRPERLRNPTVATLGMRRIYTAQQDANVDISDELSLIRQELDKSIRELRKETPSTLKEDNTALVKHLRERKRRLLADTIKDVAQMGVRRNLATAELEKQARLSSALVVMGAQQDGESAADLQAADQALHDLLDAMPSARNALAEHSPDLTDGEVRRGVGLLEGLLQHGLKQREDLLKMVADLIRLHDVEKQLLGLCSVSETSGVVFKRQIADGGLALRLDWLPEILMVAAKAVSFQISEGGLRVQGLVDVMEATAEEVRGFKEQLLNMPSYPAGLGDKATEELQQYIWRTLQAFGDQLREWETAEPNVGFLVIQLLPWTEQDYIAAQSNGIVTNSINHLSVSSLDRSIRDLSDTLFVALQQLTAVKTIAVSSTEDPGWLVRNDKHFAESARALHLPDITAKLDQVLTSLQHLRAENLSLATALLKVARPTVQQFCIIARHQLSRQANIHAETVRLASFLAKSFAGVATEGFCSPVDPSEGKDDEKEGKLESGTGLGDGEGAEDISKDVGADEDLTEFAQGEQNKEEREDGELEDVEGAVDMGMDELEGRFGEEEGQKEDGDDEEGGSDGEEDEGKEMDEEMGSVDDLDPTAVDEKMWDEAGREDENKSEEKELKGEKKEGEKTGEQVERGEDEEKAEAENEGEVEEGEGQEEVDDVEDMNQECEGKAEAENADPHLQEEKALELPEELQLNGEDEADGKSDDDDEAMDDLSDVEQPQGQGEREEVDSVDGGEEQKKDADDVPDEVSLGDEDEDVEGQAQDDEIVEDQQQEEEDEAAQYDQREGEMQLDENDENNTGGGDKGAANQLQDEIDPEQTNEGQNQREEQDSQDDKQQQRPQASNAAENQDEGEADKGAVERGQGRQDDAQPKQNEALRKLADVLEQWHQRREIFNPAEERSQQKIEAEQDVDMKNEDFEHLADSDDEDEQGDAQALGAAEPGQTQNVDMSKAIQDEDVAADEDTVMPDVSEQDNEVEEQAAAAERLSRLRANAANPDASRQDAGAVLPDDQDPLRRRNLEDDGLDRDGAESQVSETADQVQQLELSADTPAPPTSTANAAQLWSYCSAITHPFALMLTEQLRLILHPTTATKLRGDFRTGKRLNLKRIIPYIASGYKRDKIWMRRSVPSKRNYQILLAIDDSKSMCEGGKDLMALQTASLLCKSLAMLEVGEVAVLGFGEGDEGVKVACPFGSSWSEARGDGVKVFEGLGFRQGGTDVKRCVKEGLKLLTDARSSGPSAGEETWQLMVLVSDGHCGEHDEVRRLVRRAREERVMIVFVILDALASGGDAAAAATNASTGAGESILDLKEAIFEEGPDGQMKVVTRRYLERFPFEHYLVVRDVRELPGILGRCLRGWFAEVEGR